MNMLCESVRNKQRCRYPNGHSGAHGNVTAFWPTGPQFGLKVRERNAKIWEMRQCGATHKTIGAAFGITGSRALQICNAYIRASWEITYR